MTVAHRHDIGLPMHFTAFDAFESTISNLLENEGSPCLADLSQSLGE